MNYDTNYDLKYGGGGINVGSGFTRSAYSSSSVHTGMPNSGVTSTGSGFGPGPQRGNVEHFSHGSRPVSKVTSGGLSSSNPLQAPSHTQGGKFVSNAISTPNPGSHPQGGNTRLPQNVMSSQNGSMGVNGYSNPQIYNGSSLNNNYNNNQWMEYNRNAPGLHPSRGFVGGVPSALEDGGHSQYAQEGNYQNVHYGSDRRSFQGGSSLPQYHSVSAGRQAGPSHHGSSNTQRRDFDGATQYSSRAEGGDFPSSTGNPLVGSYPSSGLNTSTQINNSSSNVQNISTNNSQQVPYRSQYRSQIASTPSQGKLTTSALMSDYSTLGESKTLLENFSNTKHNRPQPSKHFTNSSKKQNSPQKKVPSLAPNSVKRPQSALRQSSSSNVALKRSSTPSNRTNVNTTSNLNGSSRMNASSLTEASILLNSKPFHTLHEHAELMKKDVSAKSQQQARSAAEQEYLKGMSEYDNLHFEDALRHFQSALNMVETAQDNDHTAPGDHVEVLANIFLGMGIVYYALGRDKAAVELYNRCIECLREKFGSDYPGMVSALVNIGLINMNQKKYEEALTTFLKAQKLAENVLGMDRLGLADIYHNIGVIYDAQGNLQDALSYYKRSLRIREKLSGDHPITALTYENMAMIYKDQKQFEEAISLQTKVLNIRKTFFGTNNKDFALAVFNLGGIYKSQGKYKKALAYLQKAHKIRCDEFGVNHEQTQEALQILNSVKAKLEQQTKRKQSMYTL